MTNDKKCHPGSGCVSGDSSPAVSSHPDSGCVAGDSSPAVSSHLYYPLLHTMMVCKVAEHIFRIVVADNCPAWSQLSWHYAPFVSAETEELLFDISVNPGHVDTSDLQEYTTLYDCRPTQQGEIWLRIYDAAGTSVSDTSAHRLIIILQQPGSTDADARLHIDFGSHHASLTIRDTGVGIAPAAYSSITQGIQLAYMLYAAPSHTLMAHAAAVIDGGLAYLFIAPSGTGKSTHARLWLNHIPGCSLLNDDHPVVRVFPDGAVRAYGSPWSGKTDCYINAEAPLAAIIRIEQAPATAIRRLPPLEAYASLTASFSGLTWIRSFADVRHATLERLVMDVPCYTLRCRPDAEAALTCHKAVSAPRQS